MSIVNMLQAKTNLSKLVEAVESGAEDEIIIARNGKPAARLVPVNQPKKAERRLGIANGKYPDFNWEEWQATDKEVARMFDDSMAYDQQAIDDAERRRAALNEADDDASAP